VAKKPHTEADDFGDLFAGAKMQRGGGAAASSKRDERIDKLEELLANAQKRARMWEMSYMSQKRGEMRLIAMLLDLGIPAEKLADWQKQLDHIEAIKMDGKKRVTSVALASASEDLDVR
jgi:hypothetical protein